MLAAAMGKMSQVCRISFSSVLHRFALSCPGDNLEMMNRRTFLSFLLAACCWLSKLMNFNVRRQDTKTQTKTPGRLRLEEFWAEDR